MEKHGRGAAPFIGADGGRFIPKFGLNFPFKRAYVRDKILSGLSSNRLRFVWRYRGFCLRIKAARWCGRSGAAPGHGRQRWRAGSASSSGGEREKEEEDGLRLTSGARAVNQRKRERGARAGTADRRVGRADKWAGLLKREAAKNGREEKGS